MPQPDRTARAAVKLDLETDAYSTATPSSGASALTTSTTKPATSVDPVPIARKLTALWARMIDAPLEKILEDDCQAQAMDLLHQMNLATVMPGPLEVAAVIRMIAVGLDLPPPTGAALRIYHKVLGQLPLPLLRNATELLIKSYTYPSFPKPAEWMNRGGDHLRLIERARFMIEIYEKRRRIAELYYGKEVARRREAAARNNQIGVAAEQHDAFDLE